MKGSGLVNNLIDKLPFELHIPTYSFCGPGTKLKTRLDRGDVGINQLDNFCKDHDITYSKNKDTRTRNIADKILAERAWKRFKAKDSSVGEKAAALAVTNIMKLKSKLGMGLKNKKSSNCLKKVIKSAKKYMIKNSKYGNLAIKSAILGAKAEIEKSGGKKGVKIPNVVALPEIKSGGVLPLIPIFAGLSALGALAGGASGVIKAINDIKSTKQQLNESERHNKMMEKIAIGKGLYLAPYKSGSGLYLNPPKKEEGVKKKKILKKKL